MKGYYYFFLSGIIIFMPVNIISFFFAFLHNLYFNKYD